MKCPGAAYQFNSIVRLPIVHVCAQWRNEAKILRALSFGYGALFWKICEQAKKNKKQKNDF